MEEFGLLLLCILTSFKVHAHPGMVAGWLKALFPDSSRESHEGPVFKSPLGITISIA